MSLENSKSKRFVRNRKKPMEKLSPRERQVFELLGLGYSTKQISVQLDIGQTTIDVYEERIFNKLGFVYRYELIQFAWRSRIIK